MQQEDLKKFLNGDDDDDGMNPVLNDRFEIKDHIKTTHTYKIYSGFDVVTDGEVVIKFGPGRARDLFVDNYSYLDEEIVPGLLWEETIRNNHVLVYEKKGSDIETLYKKASNNFSPITIGMIFHLSICALERVHAKKIIHGNLKPSKILTNDNEDGHKLFITGFEVCERKSSRSANKIQKSPETKAPKIKDHLYSSINSHQGQPLGYKNDLESLGYIVFNMFSNGKFFEKFTPEVSETGRQALIKLKSSLRTNPLLSSIPAEFTEYVRYINKLKVEDTPNYDQLKVLTFKLCQKIYVKNEIINVFDWVNIQEEDKSNYRARMLSYFFCSEASNSKKLKLQKFSIESIFPSKKGGSTLSITNPSPQTLQPDAQITKNFQNMPILETQEEQNATTTKYYLDGFHMDLDEEYASYPSTPRLNTREKAFINNEGKLNKLRTNVEKSQGNIDNPEIKTTTKLDELNQEENSIGSIDGERSYEENSSPQNQNIENYSMKTRKSVLVSKKSTMVSSPPLKEIEVNGSQPVVSQESKRSHSEGQPSMSKPRLTLQQIKPCDK